MDGKSDQRRTVKNQVDLRQFGAGAHLLENLPNRSSTQRKHARCFPGESRQKPGSVGAGSRQEFAAAGPIRGYESAHNAHGFHRRTKDTSPLAHQAVRI